MCHSMTSADENGTEDEYECGEIGHDTVKKVEQKLPEGANKAVKKGLLKKYVKELEYILLRRIQTFFIQLGYDEPETVPPMKI